MTSGDEYEGTFIEGKKHGEFFHKLKEDNNGTNGNTYRNDSLYRGRGLLKLRNGITFYGWVERGIPDIEYGFKFLFDSGV